MVDDIHEYMKTYIDCFNDVVDTFVHKRNVFHNIYDRETRRLYRNNIQNRPISLQGACDMPREENNSLTPQSRTWK